VKRNEQVAAGEPGLLRRWRRAQTWWTRLEVGVGIRARRRPSLNASHLQRLGVDEVGGLAIDEVDDVVERGLEVQLVAVLLHVADVRRADGVFQAQQRVALQDGLALEHIHRRHARAGCG
jgi:hypothetical protein